MRIDIVLSNDVPHALAEVKAAPELEQMGYDGLWLTDHVIGLKIFGLYDSHWLEMLTTLGYMAAATSRIRLGTGVLVLPYRNPVLTAKMLSTLDTLSNGRVDFGVGTGWAEREFDALGAGAMMKDRGRVTDETLDLILRCWQGGTFDWKSEHFAFERIIFDPVPVQKPRIPIWIGARGVEANAPLRRAVKYADIWHPTNISVEDVRVGGAKLDEMAGRSIPRSIRKRLMPTETAEQMAEQLQAYQEVGCIAAVVDLKVTSVREFMQGTETLARARAMLR